MKPIRITKKFTFETGHALYGYDGKLKYGMVIDFSDLKEIVKKEIVSVFDHATVFNKNTPHIELAKELEERGHNVLLVDYQPTSEMMIIDFAEKIKRKLPQNIQLHSLKLQETDTSYAQWFASDI
jgi:6-pyruvoyltetrahydropterin/6-carboxytetrahydropterin synthase